MRQIIFYQPPAFGLGDFIESTPTLVALFDRYKTKIGIYFSSALLKEIYSDAPFFDLLEQQPKFFDLDSRHDRYLNLDVSNHISYFNTYGVPLGLAPPIPGSYVPYIKTSFLDRSGGQRYCAILRGSHSDKYHYMKDPGDETYKRICLELNDRNIIPVFIGGPEDEAWWFRSMKKWGRHIDLVNRGARNTIGALYECDFVVANDTGLAHAAAAMRKSTCILWKHTFLKFAPCQPWVTIIQSGAVHDGKGWYDEFCKWADHVANQPFEESSLIRG